MRGEGECRAKLKMTRAQGRSLAELLGIAACALVKVVLFRIGGMKQLKPFSLGVFCHYLGCVTCCVFAGCMTQSPFSDAGPPTAKVVRLKGAARYATGGTAGRVVKEGDKLHPGDALQTAGNSQLKVSLTGAFLKSPKAGGAFIRIGENALFGIDVLNLTRTNGRTAAEIQFNLKAGHMYAVLPPLTKTSVCEVTLPGGVAGTRGAICDLTAEGVVQVLSGSVVLVYARTNRTLSTQTVGAAQEFDPRSETLISSVPAKKFSSTKRYVTSDETRWWRGLRTSY